MNPNTDPKGPRLTITVEGPMYSKRRMAVVLWIHREDMFCVPLYSFEGKVLMKKKGLMKKPEFLRREYVSIKNAHDKAFVQQGPNDSVDADLIYKDLHPTSAIHITGGFKVACAENTAIVGRLTERGHKVAINTVGK
jgi:hypothetical protein